MYYKVVKIRDGKKVSCVAKGDATIVYSTEEWSVVPPFLKLIHRGPLVFDKLESAIPFAEREYCEFKMEVWECEAVNPRNPGAFYDLDLLSFGCTRSASMFYAFPKHTIECDSIKLIKRVFEKEPN